MAGWAHLAREAPTLANLAEGILAARRLRTLATLRRDGSPRLSEISGAWVRDGEFWLGLIPSAKERDLGRDPRCSVHCGSATDTSSASLRVSGHAERAAAGALERLGMARGHGEPTFTLYRLDLAEVVVTTPDPESRQIHVEWWNLATGVGRLTRRGG